MAGVGFDIYPMVEEVSECQPTYVNRWLCHTPTHNKHNTTETLLLSSLLRASSIVVELVLFNFLLRCGIKRPSLSRPWDKQHTSSTPTPIQTCNLSLPMQMKANMAVKAAGDLHNEKRAKVLEIIDKLRELGVSESVSLPQV